ncbi:hypothetical protein ACLB2K_016014 [Fragaria x ananassa]
MATLATQFQHLRVRKHLEEALAETDRQLKKYKTMDLEPEPTPSKPLKKIVAKSLRGKGLESTPSEAASTLPTTSVNFSSTHSAILTTGSSLSPSSSDKGIGSWPSAATGME